MNMFAYCMVKNCTHACAGKDMNANVASSLYTVIAIFYTLIGFFSDCLHITSVT